MPAISSANSSRRDRSIDVFSIWLRTVVKCRDSSFSSMRSCAAALDRAISRAEMAVGVSRADDLGDKYGNLLGNWVFRLGMKEYRQDRRCQESQTERYEKELMIIDVAVGSFE